MPPFRHHKGRRRRRSGRPAGPAAEPLHPGAREGGALRLSEMRRADRAQGERAGLRRRHGGSHYRGRRQCAISRPGWWRNLRTDPIGHGLDEPIRTSLQSFSWNRRAGSGRRASTRRQTGLLLPRIWATTKTKIKTLAGPGIQPHQTPASFCRFDPVMFVKKNVSMHRRAATRDRSCREAAALVLAWISITGPLRSTSELRRKSMQFAPRHAFPS